jgi:hypothetical protein
MRLLEREGKAGRHQQYPVGAFGDRCVELPLGVPERA